MLKTKQHFSRVSKAQFHNPENTTLIGTRHLMREKKLLVEMPP